MRQFVQNLLAALTRKILAKYKPKIIGITGSVGKTSAKEAVFLAVAEKFKTRKAIKNFNTEFGVPFTVIGVDDPERNVFKWGIVVLKALGMIIFPLPYPELLILELGIEFPNDMDVLMKLVHPDTGVITSIGISHYEFFKTQDAVLAEKSKLAQALTPDDVLILNADDPGAMSAKAKTSAKVMTYGFAETADVKVSELVEQLEENKYRTKLKIKRAEDEIAISFPALGKPHVHAIICATAVALSLGVEKDLIEHGLAAYKPAPGRLNIFAGLKHSTIIDDSYNAAPDSMRAALELLTHLSADKKIAVLGDMLELGEKSDEEHKKMGQYLAGLNLAKVISVGPQGRLLAEAAIASGLPQDRVASFSDSLGAIEAVQNVVEPGALILLKGSQGVRLEKITKEIMAEPMRSAELLPRQSGRWLEAAKK